MRTVKKAAIPIRANLGEAASVGAQSMHAPLHGVGRVQVRPVGFNPRDVDDRLTDIHACINCGHRSASSFRRLEDLRVGK